MRDNEVGGVVGFGGKNLEVEGNREQKGDFSSEAQLVNLTFFV